MARDRRRTDDLPPATFSAAGASARREWERRSKAREARIRAQHPRIGGALLALAGEPEHHAAWRRGADGEERVAAVLERHAASHGVLLLHDRRLPGTRANIDHLAIGPGGVTVIDTKRYHGKVEIRRCGGLLSPRVERLFVAGRDRTSLVEGVRRQAAVVRDALHEAGATVAEVRPVLCWADPGELPGLGRAEVLGVPVLGPRRTARLTARPGPVRYDQVQLLRRLLAHLFPPA